MSDFYEDVGEVPAGQMVQQSAPFIGLFLGLFFVGLFLIFAGMVILPAWSWWALWRRHKGRHLYGGNDGGTGAAGGDPVASQVIKV